VKVEEPPAHIVCVPDIEAVGLALTTMVISEKQLPTAALITALPGPPSAVYVVPLTVPGPDCFVKVIAGLLCNPPSVAVKFLVCAGHIASVLVVFVMVVNCL
jgi:hypothetical protein